MENVFKDFQFRGKGFEKSDLDHLLNLAEHWVHFLSPRYPLDQTLERIEYLGKKNKCVKAYLKKIRLGLVDNEFELDTAAAAAGAGVPEFDGFPSDDEIEIAANNVPAIHEDSNEQEHEFNFDHGSPSFDRAQITVLPSMIATNTDSNNVVNSAGENNATSRNNSIQPEPDFPDGFDDDDDEWLMNASNILGEEKITNATTAIQQ